MKKISTKDKSILVSNSEKSAIRKNLNLLKGFLLLVFSDGKFQLSYYF